MIENESTGQISVLVSISIETIFFLPKPPSLRKTFSVFQHRALSLSDVLQRFSGRLERQLELDRSGGRRRVRAERTSSRNLQARVRRQLRVMGRWRGDY